MTLSGVNAIILLLLSHLEVFYEEVKFFFLLMRPFRFAASLPRSGVSHIWCSGRTEGETGRSP